MDDETQRAIGRMLLTTSFWATVCLVVTYGILVRRTFASRRIRPGRRTTVVGTVVDAPELLPCPAPGGPCVFWASQTDQRRFLHCRGRAFRLRSAEVGDVRLTLFGGDCRGMSFETFLLDEEGSLREKAHRLAALDEAIAAAGGDPEDYTAVRETLIRAARGRSASEDGPSGGHGPRKYSTRVNIVRVGDHVSIRGYFEPVDGAGFGYRDRIESVPMYRVVGDRRELLAKADPLRLPAGRLTPLFVDRGSLAQIRSPRRVLEPRWLVVSLGIGFILPGLVSTLAMLCGAHGLATHPLLRWFD